MGMFDSVYASCPKCNSGVEFQSKAHDCYLANYAVGSTIPLAIVADLDGKVQRCDACGTDVGLRKEFTLTLIVDPHP